MYKRLLVSWNQMVAFSKGRMARLVGMILIADDAADDLMRVDLGGRRIIKKYRQSYARRSP
ncbi:hypothetical protein JMUB7523_26510 [Staphylococcus aureus]